MSPLAPETRYIIVHENVVSSWAKDAGTFGAIGLLAWANHTVIGGSWVLDLLAVVVVLTMGSVRFSRRTARVTERELVDWASPAPEGGLRYEPQPPVCS